MKRRRTISLVIAAFAIAALCLGPINIHIQYAQADFVQKQIFGNVTANGTVRAWDAVQNGVSYFYIQNRTNEGDVMDIMMTTVGPPIADYYDPYISGEEGTPPETGFIIDWQTGDPGIMIVERDYGIYGVDHAGYISFIKNTLDSEPTQLFDNSSLQKIPTATLDLNGTGFINMSWTPLDDPDSLIAGYKIYRSETNGTVAGDDDWTLVGGTNSTPITDNFFNDTGVIANTTYYYSVKIVFTGYQNNDIAQVDNHQNMYFGEGSAPMISPESGLIIDYIVIEYANGTAVDTIYVDVGQDTPQVFAQGYTSGDVWVGSVEVDWVVDVPTLGSCSPTPSTFTVFTANFQGGPTLVTGANATLSDDFNIVVNDPTVDYILLTYTEDGMEIPDLSDWNLSEPLEIYASGYNLTDSISTYVGLVTVDWTDVMVDTGDGDFSITPSNITIFTGTALGHVNITGQNALLEVIDWFIIKLVLGGPPTVDYIEIRSAPGGGGIDLGDPANYPTYPVGHITDFYGAAYNTSTGYIGDVDSGSTWVSSNTTIVTVTSPGISSTITCDSTEWGVVTITLDDQQGHTDTTNITVPKPTVDYITITDAADGNELTRVVISTGGFVAAYASGYNNTAGYVDLVDVDWSVDYPLLGYFSTITGTNTIFYANATAGEVDIVGENMTMTPTVSDNFTVDIQVLLPDRIVITDEFGVELTTVNLDVGGEITVYAWGYNDEYSTFTGLETVDWSDSPDLGSFSADTANTTTFTLVATSTGTTTITADHATLVDDTFDIAINPPTVDYILIVDTSGTGVTEIPDQTVGVGITIPGYAASFNTTFLYIADIIVDWTVDNAGGATGETSLSSGINSDFYSGETGGTVTWTADDGVHQDTVVFTITPPTIDSIKIMDAAGGTGNEVDTAAFTIGGVVTDMYYCAGFNASIDYVQDVSATWALDGDAIGTLDPETGTSTTFTATTAGTGTITATFGTLTDSTGNITVSAAEDTTPPAVPTGLEVQLVPAGEALKLVWTANTETDLAGYNIYRSTSETGAFEKINTDLVTDTTYTDSGLTNGNTYYYKITAVDDAPTPNESGQTATASNTVDADTDNDGTYNSEDDDDDGDGLLDTEEDKNGNGIKDDDETDPLLWDTDGDGKNDKEDKYPLDDSKWKEEKEELPIMLIVIPLIIIIIIILILFMMMKRKPKEAPPEMPEEEAPAEEEMPEEEEAPMEEEVPEEEEITEPEEEVSPEEEVVEEEEMPEPEEESERELPPPPGT
ncbi:MAG: fibronectin type III domain-containing protein [Thermoplasmata archaeon]|nr:MAG: fibronectin type III domain-containing protein [Thermoplasmata archaeon]